MSLKTSLLALILLFSFSFARAADSSGALLVTQAGGGTVAMPLEHTTVSIEVSAFVARASVEQTFRNPFDTPVEAVYTFPLGDRAAVDDFELVVGSRVVRGEIKRREEARQEYEEARGQGYQAALLEQERPNVFTQSVANLLPGEKIVVRLRTVETLAYERGSYRLTFPLVVGPRYLPGGGRVADPEKVSPPVLPPSKRSGHDVSIDVTIDAGVPVGKIESPSHRINLTRLDARRAKIALAEGDTIPNKDFLLRWSVAADDPAIGVLAHRDGIDGFFTLLVQPKGEVSAVEAAPKEITFVVDTSGSMSGIPIEASKRFIAQALHELGPKDTFNLIRFAGDNAVWSRSPRPNTRADVEEGIAWLEGLRGGGGTELLSALRAAFQRPTDPKRVRVVIFATDGYVGNEPEILGAIGGVLGDARIYTIGIGTSVNHYLLDRMADLGRGSYVFVRPDESADDALNAFRSWVTRPYLTDLEIDWGALPVADVMPEHPRDLHSGETLAIVGRYVGDATGEVVVRGKLGGVLWERRIRVELPKTETKYAALGSLWARRRVEGLMLESPARVPDSIRAEVTALALEHRILTAYTSFIAVDTARVANPGGAQIAVHQALPIPDLVSFEGIFGKDGPGSLRVDAIAAAPEDAAQVEQVKTESRRVAHGADSGLAGGLLVMALPPPPSLPPSAELAKRKTAQPVSLNSPRERNIIGVSNQAASPSSPGSPELRETYAAGAGAKFDRAQDGSADFNVVPFEASARLRDAALRVLADLAEDGKLSPSGGRPALAALLAAQRKGGAISDDVGIHAVATWALAEAAARCKNEPWVNRAAKDAAAHLRGIAKMASGDELRWARLALAITDPNAPRLSAAGGAPGVDWKRLASAMSQSPAPGAKLAGGPAFDRLCANLRRGNLLAGPSILR